jgi:hypothetical protein
VGGSGIGCQSLESCFCSDVLRPALTDIFNRQRLPNQGQGRYLYTSRTSSEAVLEPLRKLAPAIDEPSTRPAAPQICRCRRADAAGCHINTQTHAPAHHSSSSRDHLDDRLHVAGHLPVATKDTIRRGIPLGASQRPAMERAKAEARGRTTCSPRGGDHKTDRHGQ